ncbi:monofunctional biosynthetic peptidoglycan transglycosylase [Sphingoaurantiacus capsulatus]|uniref:Biosynthetic peptidoglycan transglycosylase n=1 Tax=Sphingoaurantiacus capsulatus TaxID=1771310 RepID=A0ABV7XDF3_9SPHN
MSFTNPPRSRFRRVLKWLLILVLLVILASVGWVFVYKYINPPTTTLMLRAGLQGHSVAYTWRDLDRIDPNMPRAVITAEDRDFCAHNGFDMAAIRDAFERNKEGGKLRGGSTVSQQTAKNAFLWGERSWVRKGLEAYFTFLIERIWGKRRIMEVYLNIAETGIHTYGVEEGARRYFGHGAETLSRREAGQIAAVLPSPQKRSGKNPRGEVRRYARNIERWIRVVKDEKLDSCLMLKD